jgi:hypothetical protein
MMKSLAAIGSCVLLSGCGAVSSTLDCSDNQTIVVAPLIGSADHSASAPDNQQKFAIFNGPGNKPGCAAAQHIVQVYGTWTSADPLNVSVSSATDPTNGTATCTGATAGPVTLTAKYGTTAAPMTSTVQMTCK